MLSKALQFGINHLVSPAVLDIVKISDISYNDKKLTVKLFLNGLDNNEIVVTCNYIRISDNCDFVSIGKFSSNMAFAENVLNSFAAKTYTLPEGTATYAICKLLKAIFDI